MPIGRQRPHVREAQPLRIEEIGAESIEPDHPVALGRLEMRQQGNEARHSEVLVRRLSRKAPEHVPTRLEAEFLAPLQQLDVLQRTDSLAHQLEDRIAEALDAGLDAPDAGVAKAPQLTLPEVCL